MFICKARLLFCIFNILNILGQIPLEVYFMYLHILLYKIKPKLVIAFWGELWGSIWGTIYIFSKRYWHASYWGNQSSIHIPGGMQVWLVVTVPDKRGFFRVLQLPLTIKDHTKIENCFSWNLHLEFKIRPNFWESRKQVRDVCTQVLT